MLELNDNVLGVVYVRKMYVRKLNLKTAQHTALYETALADQILLFESIEARSIYRRTPSSTPQ